MLFTKPINEITYQDVIEFCEGDHAEGFILEYKRDFPSNEMIAKTIAAFANTYGGLLVIGVAAPNGRPVPPFEGIAFDGSLKYEEKIESVVLSHIREPVFPETRVCEPVDGKTFVLVRVSESHLTPHRVAANSRIYVRTGQSSTPNEEASWDKIEWLASRRRKSEEFRELLIEEGNRYFRDACKLRGIDPNDKKHYFAVLSLAAVPLFPRERLVPFKNLDRIGNQIRVHDRAGNQFPRSFYEGQPIQEGIRKLYIAGDDATRPVHGSWFEYTHLNSFGLYLYKRDIGIINTGPGTNPDGSPGSIELRTINFHWISSPLHQFLSSAVIFYEKLAYWGTVQVKVELTNALGTRLAHPLSGQIALMDHSDLLVPSDHLTWEETVPFPTLRDHLRDVVVEIVDSAAWSLGVRYFTEDRIRASLKENFGD